MRKSPYHERDFSFGRAMLTLRARIGLTQAGMAETLGISRKAVALWEGGNCYPKTEHLQQIITLAIQRQIFPPGRVAEEVHTLWESAHQKMLLDEAWLATLLPQPNGSPGLQAVGWIPVTDVRAPRIDWNNAPAVPNFYGREWEMDLLTDWIVTARCRVVSVLGLGGIGKSALTVSLMHRLAGQFEVVIWQSLTNLPTYEHLMKQLLRVLAPQLLNEAPTSLEERQDILREQMRQTRVLVVLDNLDTALEEGEGTGRMRSEFTGLERFLHLTAETKHQSCVLLTSREEPAVLGPLAGSQGPVRSLHLASLDDISCDKLLAEKELIGNLPDRMRLIKAYTGNPLALKIVAHSVANLFKGDIAQFLEQGELIYGGIRDLLEQQFSRLSRLEQSVLLWLAVLREPATLDELLDVFIVPVGRARLLEALDTLYRHSLIEHGIQQSSFTLQSLVMDYLTSWLIVQATVEIQEGHLDHLLQQGLELAPAWEDVRVIQERLIVVPILNSLRNAFSESTALEECLRELLRGMAFHAGDEQGYGPSNLVTLLSTDKGNLRGMDLSGLSMRGAYLQGIEMQDTDLSEATLQDTVFTKSFDAIMGLAVSPTGDYWAGATRHGEIRLWNSEDQGLQRIWHAHAEGAWSLAFSPDGQRLVSGGWDGLVKLWKIESGELLWSAAHSGYIARVAFSPDGDRIASAGAREVILWDAEQGEPTQTLVHPNAVVSLTWSPNGRLLATGDLEGVIRLWAVGRAGPAIFKKILAGHTGSISELAFAPDGTRLASASIDSTVKLWNIPGGGLRKTLTVHSEPVHRVAWSPDGRLLASGGQEKTIWLWDFENGRYCGNFQGHSDAIIDLAFTPDNRGLVSSGDNTLRRWDIASGRCIRVLQGYPAALVDVDWSPDGKSVVSGGLDKVVTISDVAVGTSPRLLEGHTARISGVGWSPDGLRLATSSWDKTIRHWDLQTGECLQMLHLQDHPDPILNGIAWSPDGQWLASPTYVNAQGVLLWDVTEGTYSWLGQENPTAIRRVAWNPDGRRLAGGGENGVVYVWDTQERALCQLLTGHRGPVKSVAWCADGKRLVSAGGGVESGELFVWDIDRGERTGSFAAIPGMVYAIVWALGEEIIVTGGSDGALRWWDLRTFECTRICAAHRGTVQSLKQSPEGTRLASCGDDGAVMIWDLHTGEHLQTLRRDRPYERLNISGIRGLSEAQKENLRLLGAIDKPNGIVQKLGSTETT